MARITASVIKKDSQSSPFLLGALFVSDGWHRGELLSLDPKSPVQPCLRNAQQALVLRDNKRQIGFISPIYLFIFSPSAQAFVCLSAGTSYSGTST